MTAWKTTVATEYCTSVRDGTHDSPKSVSDGFPLITSKAIKDGQLDFDSANLISQQDFDEINRRSKVDQWDILFTMIGTLGEVYLERSGDINYAIKNVGLFKVGDELKAQWLYYWFRTPSIKNEILQHRRGASQQYLPLGTLRNLVISHPADWGIARRIIEIISTYDDLIENNRRRIQLLEESARLLYQEWFVHLRFPGYEQVKIIDGVPEGWVSGVVSDFFDTSSGGTPSRKVPEYYTGDIPWVKTQELNDGYIFTTSERITEEAIKKSSAKLFPAGTVLIAMYGATIGETGVLAVDAASNQACCALFPKHEGLTAEFTHLFAMHSKQGLINLSQGAAQNNISQQVVRNYPFIMPSEILLKEFNEVVSNIYKQKANLEKQNASLAKARDLLLPKLMSGELTV